MQYFVYRLKKLNAAYNFHKNSYAYVEMGYVR